MLEDPQKILMSKISNFLEKNFKFFGEKCQKWLYWVLANTKRNKVMNFGEPTSNYGAAANKFIVVRAIMAQP